MVKVSSRAHSFNNANSHSFCTLPLSSHGKYKNIIVHVQIAQHKLDAIQLLQALAWTIDACGTCLNGVCATYASSSGKLDIVERSHRLESEPTLKGAVLIGYSRQPRY